MTSVPIPEDLAIAIGSDDAGPRPDRLEELVAIGSELREVEAEITDTTARLEALTARRHAIRTALLPTKMDECGVSAVEIQARGNWPAARVEIASVVGANIAAAWDEGRRRAGFDYLDADGSGDLIKTTVVIKFPREQRARALELASSLRAEQWTIEVSETVHSGTLSAWLRDRVKRGVPTPLDVIGGHVERVASLKPVGRG